MKSLFLNSIIILLLGVFWAILLPLVTYTDVTGSQSSSSSSAVPLENPLGTGNVDPRVLIGNVINAILGVVGSLALLMFIYGGVTWVISAGNEEKIAKGKNMIIRTSFFKQAKA